MLDYSLSQFELDAGLLAHKIKTAQGATKYQKIFGVPQGGVPLAMYLPKDLGIPMIEDPFNELSPFDILVVDDVVDSGNTRRRYKEFDFAALHVKDKTPKKNYPNYYMSVVPGWINYWWEPDKRNIEDVVTRTLQYIGEDPTRNGLIETPERVVKSWAELFEGYSQNPGEVCKMFEEETTTSGLVYLKNIEFYSFCEHHMLPFYGKALIAYIPVDNRVIGVSKLARLLDIFARRLQIQERIAEQVTNALMEYLKPAGAACIIEAKHLCIACRGVQKQHSIMGYSSLKGIFLEKEAARLELMSLLN